MTDAQPGQRSLIGRLLRILHLSRAAQHFAKARRHRDRGLFHLGRADAWHEFAGPLREGDDEP